MPITNEELMKQMGAIQKAGNNVTLVADNARAFVMDAVSSSATLAKLFVYFAKSGTGQIDKLGVKRRTLKEHKGTATTATGTTIAEESDVPFTLKAVYLDTWIENSNTFYTARTRGQDVRAALLSLMQEQYAADLQDLAFNGDEASSDGFLALNDGYIKQAKTLAVVNYGSLSALPTIPELTAYTGEFEDKYVNGTFSWIMSRATGLHYVAAIQNRQTNLGDATIINGQLSNIAGYNVEIVDNMQNNVILFTPLQNLTVVSGLNVTLQTASQSETAIAKQSTYHFMLTDNDFVIREKNMLGYFALGDGDVTPDPEVKLSQKTMALTVGTDKSLNATTVPSDATVTWTSSDDSIATVDSDGKVTGVAIGTATITAETDDASATCTVTVS